MSNLYRALFVDPFTREVEQMEEQQHEVEVLSSFVRNIYFAKLQKDLRDLEDRCKPQPGSEGEMVYAIGVRDGIEKARLHLESLVKFVQEHTRE